MDSKPHAKSFSLPSFLKTVMEAEDGLVKVNLGLIAAAVHAAFLEFGFVASNGGKSRLPEGWASATSSVSIVYTTPDLLGGTGKRDIKDAILKFSSMGKFVLVYGFLMDGSCYIHRLCLDVSEIWPLLMSGDQEKEMSQFWKSVNDALALPLLVDISAKNGLQLPPCFDRLPTDVKFIILELLPGVDVARIGCISSEMRSLVSNDALWKRKCMEEFRYPNDKVMFSWRKRFMRCWVRRKDTFKKPRKRWEKEHGGVWVWHPTVGENSPFGLWVYPHPFLTLMV